MQASSSRKEPMITRAAKYQADARPSRQHSV